MWNWAFHARHNSQANFLREETNKVETLWQKQVERKGKVPKSYDKSYHNKRRNFLAKEVAVSFWRLRKFVITKAWKFWQRRVQFPFGDSVSKARKSIKVVRDKSSNSLTKEEKLLSQMDYLDRETSRDGPYIPICSMRAHDFARVRDLGVDLLSQVTYCLYLLNRSPRVLLKNNSSSFTQFGWWIIGTCLCEALFS